MLHRTSLIGLAIVLCTLPLWQARALAQDGPRPVKDEAKLFSEKALKEANAIILKIRETHRKDLVIQTKQKGLPAKEAGKAAQKDAEALAKSGLDGVYILITKEPRHFEVQPVKTQGEHFKVTDRDELATILRTTLGKDQDEALLRVAQRTLDILNERGKSKVDPPTKPLVAVQDDAKLFSNEAIEKAKGVIAKIKEKHQRDLFIETLEKGPDAKEYSAFARERADKHGVDGVYVLVTTKPRRFQVEVSKKATESGLVTQTDVDELLNILKGLGKNRDDTLVQVANYTLESMTKANAQAVKQIEHLSGAWLGPQVEVSLKKKDPAGKDKKLKATLSLTFHVSGAKPFVNISHDGPGGMMGSIRPIELKDNGKKQLVIRTADDAGDLLVTYELADDALKITAARRIEVANVAGTVDLSGSWKRAAKK